VGYGHSGSSTAKMKSALTFAFHLTVAIPAVPMLALISAGLVNPVVRLGTLPRSCFTLTICIVLLAITGLWLAYAVCDPLPPVTSAVLHPPHAYFFPRWCFRIVA
jgi:hypothetical protein